MHRGRFWQARQEASVAVRASFVVLECVVERGEQLEPSLDSGVLVPHFAYAFQGLVVGEYAELSATKIDPKEFESRIDAAGLQIKRTPMPIRVGRSSADVRKGFDEAVLLLLFEGGAKPVDAGVAVHVERT